MDVQTEGSILTWHISGFYGWPKRKDHPKSWQLLRRISPTTGTPWLCMGDFNEIMWAKEKRGGNTRTTKQMSDFRETTTALQLKDLGYQGSTFTWSNGRVGSESIQSRLDRALATEKWFTLFPSYMVHH
ncbi:hypothetical protein ACS0TY_030369 [Phlomoides rotata]